MDSEISNHYRQPLRHNPVHVFVIEVSEQEVVLDQLLPGGTVFTRACDSE